MSRAAALCEGLTSVLKGQESILLGYLFGSWARGEASDASDVDVAVLPRGPLTGRQLGVLIEELEAATNCRRLDLVDLSVAPPLVAFQVVREGLVLVERDAEARFDFEQSAIRRFEDTRYLRRVQHELLRERAQHGRQG